MFVELLCWALGVHDKDQNKITSCLRSCGSNVIQFSITHKPNSMLWLRFIGFKTSLGTFFFFTHLRWGNVWTHAKSRRDREIIGARKRRVIPLWLASNSPVRRRSVRLIRGNHSPLLEAGRLLNHWMESFRELLRIRQTIELNEKPLTRFF